MDEEKMVPFNFVTSQKSIIISNVCLRNKVFILIHTKCFSSNCVFGVNCAQIAMYLLCIYCVELDDLDCNDRSIYD